MFRALVIKQLMIFLYGDSHAERSFKGLQLPFVDCHCNSITMHRIGRDGIIINFDPSQHTKDSVLCFAYGEVDCRCHVQKQINLGRDENEVISELVQAYFCTLKKNIQTCRAVIIVGVLPPTDREECEFPVAGSDEDRVRFTRKLNRLLKSYCSQVGYIYLAPYSHYTREDGLMIRELSDENVHLGDTSFFLDEFMKVMNSLT